MSKMSQRLAATQTPQVDPDLQKNYDDLSTKSQEIFKELGEIAQIVFMTTKDGKPFSTFKIEDFDVEAASEFVNVLNAVSVFIKTDDIDQLDDVLDEVADGRGNKKPKKKQKEPKATDGTPRTSRFLNGAKNAVSRLP